jgi:NitT/TauT family transport system substrate-binding protein
MYTEPVEVITSGTVREYSALSIIAQDRGYFRENNLDVRLKEYSSGPPAVAAMLAGEIDTATAADFVGVSNSFKNEDLRILATQLRADSFFLVVRADHNIAAPNDLKGKKIGVTNKTAGEFYLGQFLVLNQLDNKDVNISYHTPDEMVNKLISGTLDAIVTFDPHVNRAQTSLGDKASVWSPQGDQKLSTLLYGTGKLVKKRPEAVKRYLQAIVQAETFAQNNDTAAQKIVARYLGYDDAYMQTLWSRLAIDVSLGQDLLISMEDQARWAIDNNIVSNSNVPDYFRLVYFDGLEAVKPDGITIIR